MNLCSLILGLSKLQSAVEKLDYEVLEVKFIGFGKISLFRVLQRVPKLAFAQQL
jgi:hypothetical protein